MPSQRSETKATIGGYVDVELVEKCHKMAEDDGLSITDFLADLVDKEHHRRELIKNEVHRRELIKKNVHRRAANRRNT